MHQHYIMCQDMRRNSRYLVIGLIAQSSIKLESLLFVHI